MKYVNYIACMIMFILALYALIETRHCSNDVELRMQLLIVVLFIVTGILFFYSYLNELKQEEISKLRNKIRNLQNN